MRVIVTGATSFIGTACVKEIIKEGHQVLAVIRPDSPGRAALEKTGGAELLSANLSEIASIKEAPQAAAGADAWLHLGWEGAGSANRANAALQRKNIGYALEALRTAKALGCGRFLFSGSQAEYGICHEVMKEDMECHPVSEYGKDKLAVCRQAAGEAKELGIDYLHARIFSVYGPGDHPWSLVETCLDRLLAGEEMELGDCTQDWNYLYITDAARALAQLLLGKAAPGVYNVAGEDTRPLRSYIEQLHRLCGGRGNLAYGRRPPNAEGVTSLRPDISKLKTAAIWHSQVDFETGIRRMIRLRAGGDADKL